MSWATLTIGEIGMIFAAAAALALWLYLRQPRASRLRVSTLRFWENAPSGAASARRRKLRDPLPLAMQLLLLLALIAALGNPRLGAVGVGRTVAVVLDAGAWSQTQRPGPDPRAQATSTELDQIRSEANNFLSSIPANDPILLLRADSNGAPLLPFTTDRSAIRAALLDLRSSSTVADVPGALTQARGALHYDSTKSGRRGLLVYIGPGLVDQKQAAEFETFRASLAQAEPAKDAATSAGSAAPEFLMRLVGADGPPQNIGITQLSLKRSASGSADWSVTTQLRNYNDQPARVALSLSVGGHVFRQDEISIAPNGMQTASDDFTSRSGGLLQADLSPSDLLPADNHASIVLPSSQPVSVAVVSTRPLFASKMKAVLAANPYVKTDFFTDLAAVPSSEQVVVFDGQAPAKAPAAGIIEFIPVKNKAVHRVRLSNWNSGHPVTRWIQSRDVTVRVGEPPLALAAGDTVLASSSGASPQPLIIARDTRLARSVTAAFDPLDSNFTEEPAFPLLMAAAVEWMTHPVEEEGQFLTAGSVDLPGLLVDRVLAPSGKDILFASDNSATHFYAPEAGIYRVASGDQSFDVPVDVPPLPTVRLSPTASEAARLDPQPVPMAQQDLWRWLVAIALLALWLEWQFFHVRREAAPGSRVSGRAESSTPSAESSNEQSRVNRTEVQV